MYVGVVWTGREEDCHTVVAYNPQSCNWHALPPYSAAWFAMTTINNKLVLVGGYHNPSPVDRLGMWQTDNNQWTYPFPPMPTSRYLPSATSYKHWVVVAGGYRGIGIIGTVEVLDVHNKQLSTGPSTPAPWYSMMSTIIGDTWYLMGGLCGGKRTVYVYSTILSHSYSPIICQRMLFGTKYLNISTIIPLLLILGELSLHQVVIITMLHLYLPSSTAMYQRLRNGLLLGTCHVDITLVPVLSSQIDFMYLEDVMERKVSPLHTIVD